jgi:hypothetical protein
MDYAEHYDATAAKGLCWECKAKRVDESWAKDGDRWIRVESLWCLDCKVLFGMVEEAEGVQ